jgi:hypothetical protein
VSVFRKCLFKASYPGEFKNLSKISELKKTDKEYYIDTHLQGNSLVTTIGLLQSAGLINPASLSSQYNNPPA